MAYDVIRTAPRDDPVVQERQCLLIMLTSSRARYGIIARFAESAQVDVMEFSGTRNSTHAANWI